MLTNRRISEAAAAGQPVSSPSFDEEALAKVVAAAEPTRLAILVLLGERGSLCVGDIAARFRTTRPAISHHLKVLKNAGLVRSERLGQEIYYAARMERIVDTLRALADSLDACCGSREGSAEACTGKPGSC